MFLLSLLHFIVICVDFQIVNVQNFPQWVLPTWKYFVAAPITYNFLFSSQLKIVICVETEKNKTIFE